MTGKLHSRTRARAAALLAAGVGIISVSSVIEDNVVSIMNVHATSTAMQTGMGTGSGMQMASGAGPAAVKKVVTLLSDLKKELLSTAAKKQELEKKNKAWCSSETEQNSSVVSRTSSKIKDVTSFIEEQKAFRERMSSENQQVATELAGQEKELEEQKKICSKARQSYLSSEKEFVTGLNQINRALELLEKNGLTSGGGKASKASLLQVAETVKNNIGLVGGDTNSVVDLNQFFDEHASDNINGQQQAQVAAQAQAQQQTQFLQSRTSSAQAIKKVLESMRDITEENRNKAMTQESRDQKACSATEAASLNVIKSSNKSLVQKKQQIAQSSERSAKQQAELQESQRLLKETKAYVASVKAQCEAKRKEYVEESKLVKNEAKAMSKAIEILGKAATIKGARKFFAEMNRSVASSFLQLGSGSGAKANENLREVLSALEKISPKLARVAQRDYLLYQSSAAATSTSGDPFASVKKLIQGMIERLSNEAAEASTQNEWCTKENKKSGEQKAQKTKEIKKLTSRMNEMQASLAEYNAELKQMKKVMTDMEGNV
jgi:hypothetical protein